MQILNLWGLTYAQETEGHPAEEPGGHGRLGQEEVSPRWGPSEPKERGMASSSSQLHQVECGLVVI